MHPQDGYRYGKGLVLIHWATAALLAAAIGLVYSADFFDDSKFVINLHRSVGLLVLLAGVLRVARKLHEPGWISWDDNPLQRLAARATHYAIYVLLVVVPALGLLQTAAKGKPFLFFGVVPVPAVIGKDRALAESLQEWHEDLALLFIALIAVHVAAALYHRFVKKDGVLYAMLPLQRLRPAPAAVRDNNDNLPAGGQ